MGLGMEIRRYAVYYAPPAGDFATRASDWLGWDASTGATRPQPALGLPAYDITQEPRRYGFHATIKPPFRLAAGCDVAQLRQGLQALAAKVSPVTLPGLKLTNLDGFLALIPEGDTSALQNLAAQVVEGLEPYRAPLTDTEIARRRPEQLTQRQRDLLDRFGYPFVLEEFRFHLTLTDRLAAEMATQAATCLEAHFAPVLPRPFRITDLCLFGEAADGRFHLLHRYALTG